MIIKNLAASCRKQKRITLCEDKKNGIQWAGDGRGLYPMTGVPHMTADQILVLFDIPEEKRGYFPVLEYSDIWEGYDVSDSAADNEVIYTGVGLWYMGQLLCPVTTSKGLAFYTAGAFDPIRDRKDAKLYERYTEDGELYFVAKSGMIVEAIIYPEQVKKDELLILLQRTCRELEATVRADEDEEQ